MSVNNATARVRVQARKKANSNDDAAYFGPPSGTTATKRSAPVEKVDEHRVKRKRVEAPAPTTVADREKERNCKMTVAEFVKMPKHVIYRYLTQFELIPPIFPQPHTPYDPPATYLLTPPYSPHHWSRKDADGITGRRRSSRYSPPPPHDPDNQVPILADVDDMHLQLADLAESNFRNMTVSGKEEVEILAAFMCAVRKTNGNRPR